MTDITKNASRLGRLADALVDDLMSVSDEELLAEIRADNTAPLTPSLPVDQRLSASDFTQAVRRYCRVHGYSASTVRTCTDLARAAAREWRALRVQGERSE